jgi:hypothetical protein
VGSFFLVGILAAAVLVAIWYFCFTRYNRGRGIEVLRRVEAACSGQGQVVDARWLNGSRLQAHLRFAAHWFENARVTVRLLPRPLPTQWLVSRWHRQKETVTFEADLGCAPRLQLEVIRHRWVTSSESPSTKSKRSWSVVRPGPVVMTTSAEWRQELPPIVNTLMTTRGHHLLNVRFRPDSPHLAATIDLEALSDDETALGFFGVLRDLAAGASASRH